MNYVEYNHIYSSSITNHVTGCLAERNNYESSHETHHEVVAVDKAASNSESSYYFQVALSSGPVQCRVTHLPITYTVNTINYNKIPKFLTVCTRAVTSKHILRLNF